MLLLAKPLLFSKLDEPSQLFAVLVLSAVEEGRGTSISWRHLEAREWRGLAFGVA
jgi:hypothetical protein